MIGSEGNKAGLVFAREGYTVVKKEGPAGSKIERHSHPEAEVLFTVVKGHIVVRLKDGTEEHDLRPGTILNFDGSNTIEAELIEDSEAFVTLIKK